jgi:hypothetical protein
MTLIIRPLTPDLWPALSPSASGSGYASTFPRAGFREVVRRIPARPIMRHDLKGIRSRAP